MKGTSVSLEAADIQSAARNGNTFGAFFDRRLFATSGCGCSPDITLVAKSVLHSRFNLILSPFFGLRILYRSCSAFADAAAQLVARAIGCVSGAFGGAIAESRSAADDFVLVCQQLLRSSNWRRLDALPGWRAYSFHDTSQRGPFLPLRGIHWSVSVVVFRRRVCGMESLGTGRLLGADPDTTFFKCARGINNRAVDRNVGDERNSGPANSVRLSRYLEACILFVRLLLVSYAVLYKFGSGADSGSSFSPSAILALGSGTIRLFGSKHCHLDCRFPGDLERIPRAWAILRRNSLNKTRFRSKYF